MNVMYFYNIFYIYLIVIITDDFIVDDRSNTRKNSETF